MAKFSLPLNNYKLMATELEQQAPVTEWHDDDLDEPLPVRTASCDGDTCESCQ
jgi:hypothetical protein